MHKQRFAIPAALMLTLAGSAAFAQQTTIQITIRNHRFEPAQPKAPQGVPLTLVVRNADKTPEEFESKTLRVEKVIPGGATSTIRLRPLKPGKYNFFGEFNEATAQGALIVE